MGHNPGALSLVVVRSPADLLSIKGLQPHEPVFRDGPNLVRDYRV